MRGRFGVVNGTLAAVIIPSRPVVLLGVEVDNVLEDVSVSWPLGKSPPDLHDSFNRNLDMWINVEVQVNVVSIAFAVDGVGDKNGKFGYLLHGVVGHLYAVKAPLNVLMRIILALSAGLAGM